MAIGVGTRYRLFRCARCSERSNNKYALSHGYCPSCHLYTGGEILQERGNIAPCVAKPEFPFAALAAAAVRASRDVIPIVPHVVDDSWPVCPHDPEVTNHVVGMYECPHCGCMVMAGMPHVAHDEDCDFDNLADAAVRQAAYETG